MIKLSLMFGMLGLVASVVARAGGSDAPVTVQSLEANGSDYTLVVIPSADARDDPYMGKCQRFTVLGTYGYLDGAYLRQPKILSEEGHLKALAYLRNALAEHRTVKLGWVGIGFVPVHAEDPCVVKSRALLLEDDKHGPAVFSFHNAI